MARTKAGNNGIESPIEETMVATTDTKDLQKQVAELTKQLKMLMNAQKTVEKSQENDLEETAGDININSDSYVKVMSLCPHTLNLSTQSKGRGKMFTFTELFQVKRILYKDLVDILETQQSFVEQGLFIILNKDVIRRHGLDDTYAKLLTKDKIEEVRKGNNTDAVNMFKIANQKQQEMIIEQIISDIINGVEKDLNYLDRLSRIVGYSIHDKAEEAKAYQEINKSMQQ